MEKTAIFRWFDSYRPTDEYWGPHYNVHVDKIGKKLYHTREELLSCGFCKTINKKIMSAKIGSKPICIHYLHSAGYLYVERASQEVLDEHLEIQALKKQVSDIDKEIRLQTIPLQKKKSEILKVIRAKTKDKKQ